jgi:abortive infection Abi-like protein
MIDQGAKEQTLILKKRAGIEKLEPSPRGTASTQSRSRSSKAGLLPALYRSVALRLQIAPSQHTEEAFKRILGGATSIVEGLGPLRNKIGDVHGQGGKLSGQAPATPSSR